MAKNGEAGRALGAALMSSLLGALIGAFALALSIPIVRPLVLTFGSPELVHALGDRHRLHHLAQRRGRARPDQRLRHGPARSAGLHDRPGAPVGLPPL